MALQVPYSLCNGPFLHLNTARTNNGHVRATQGVVSVNFLNFSAALARGGVSAALTRGGGGHKQKTAVQNEFWGVGHPYIIPAMTQVAFPAVTTWHFVATACSSRFLGPRRYSVEMEDEAIQAVRKRFRELIVNNIFRSSVDDGVEDVLDSMDYDWVASGQHFYNYTLWASRPADLSGLKCDFSAEKTLEVCMWLASGAGVFRGLGPVLVVFRCMLPVEPMGPPCVPE